MLPEKDAKRFVETNAKFNFCSKRSDDFALKYFVESNLIAFRRVK
jgi:hypothetical protein